MANNKSRRNKPKRKKEGFFTKLFNGFVTLGLTVCMLWGLQACSSNSINSLKFVQLSDTHYMQDAPNTTFKMIGESPRLLDDAINQVNDEQNVDFVMFTGDQIDKAFEKELRAFLPYAQRLNAPWYVTFGNHDRCIGGYLDTLVYLDMVRNANPNFVFKKPYYSFVPKKNYKVIVLDNIITNEITSNGYIDETQLKWLKKELDDSKNDTVLIFMHVPVVEPFASPGHKMRNGIVLKQLVESYKNPIGVFQGHYHATKITQHDNVLYVSSPALISYPNAFRVVTVANQKDKAIFNFEWKETREKTIQRMAKIMVFSGSIYAGEEKDRTGVYEVKRRK